MNVNINAGTLAHWFNLALSWLWWALSIALLLILAAAVVKLFGYTVPYIPRADHMQIAALAFAAWVLKR